jgi:hypothetical protein
LFRDPRLKVRSAIQHFSAGAVLAAIASNVIPEAVLIYLIAGELLVETIQAEDSIFSTLTLFGGFLILLALKMLG